MKGKGNRRMKRGDGINKGIEEAKE